MQPTRLRLQRHPLPRPTIMWLPASPSVGRSQVLVQRLHPAANNGLDGAILHDMSQPYGNCIWDRPDEREACVQKVELTAHRVMPWLGGEL